MEELGKASDDFVRDLSARANKRLEIVKKGTLVYVSNVPSEADVITLQDALQMSTGPIKSIVKIGDSYRVDYQNPKGAKIALEKDGIEYNGKSLHISSERPIVVLKNNTQKSIEQEQMEPHGEGLSLAVLAASNSELREALLTAQQEEESKKEQQNSTKNGNLHDNDSSSSSSSSSDEEDDRHNRKKRKKKKKKKSSRRRSRSRDRRRYRSRSRDRRRHRSRSRDRRRRRHRSRSRDRREDRYHHRRRRSHSPRYRERRRTRR